MSRIVSGFRGSVAVVFVFVAAPAFAGDRIPSKIEFNRDVRPILAENCFQCHGPDSAARKADLRFDKRDVAIELGAITPGKLEESTLVERINTTKADELMPPPKTKKVLKPEEKEILKRGLPRGRNINRTGRFWPRSVPRFRRCRMNRGSETRSIVSSSPRSNKPGLKPAPEADRRTLARRLSLDLTGLPPAPADVEAFVNDKRPTPTSSLVDRYSPPPHWGEHRGRYWLDAARYADTHGIHFDNYREMWAYRDWVINAFNHNVPFDSIHHRTARRRFAAEPHARPADRLRVQPLQHHHATKAAPSTRSISSSTPATGPRPTSQVWLGLTAGCAVCHDHKFDPLSQREFY